LNSEDDVSDEEQTDLFDTDNVVVCQYDKVYNITPSTLLKFTLIEISPINTHFN